MFEREIEYTLLTAAREAQNRGHEFIVVEHLLFALLQNKQAAHIITECGGKVSVLKNKLEEFFEKNLESVPFEKNVVPQQGLGFQRVLPRAILHHQYSSSKEISAGDMLAALFTETDSHAVYFLNAEGITRLDVLELISHGTDYESRFDSPSDGDGGFLDDEEGMDSQPTGAKELEKFTTNLNALAARGEIDPIIGRDKEIERTIQILCRRNKNNPLFVGDQGVGKTALANGLALKVHEGLVPDRLKNLKIYSLDLGGMLAGTRYRGDFEKRFKGVISELEKIPGAALFIDEIHTIVGAGATSGGTMDAANLLKPVLTGGKIKCIGSTTFEEYKNHFEKDRALARRFSKVEILEPSIPEAIEILKGLKSHFESHHGVRYSPQAIKAAVELSAKYINERFLPDKAIDVLDEAGAILSLARDVEEGKDLTVKPQHIEKVVARIARIPEQTVGTSEREKLQELETRLKQGVFGQDEALAAVASAIRRARAGLATDSKPTGSFLFTGPTGVGKTEVAKQLAHTLGMELIRFDMSEYMEKHTVARLIGAPPGYVGFDQGGLLTDAIIRHPHAVLLLDEIEKAHPDVFNILLQVMDNATLTDNNGRKADFRNVIIIMTSNVGSEGMFGQPIGFSNSPAQVGQGDIDKMFRPEFRNRLDLIVKFKPLPLEIIEKVVDKFIAEIDAALVQKKSSLILSSSARRFLAEKGYSPQYGARALHRLMQSEIKNPLADALLFGDLKNGGTAKVEVNGEKLELKFTPRTVSKREKARVES